MAISQLLLPMLKQSLDLAVDQFEQALALDPDYAFANAGLSEALGGQMIFDGEWLDGLGHYYKMSETEIFRRALSAANRSIELDPKIAEGPAALAKLFFLDGDFRSAEREYDRALAINPSLALAYMGRGELKAEFGFLDEALELLDQSLKLDPLSPTTLSSKGHVSYLAGNLDDAIESGERTLGMGHDVSLTALFLVSAYVAAGRESDAFRLLVDSDGIEASDGLEELRAAFDLGGFRAFLELYVEQEAEGSGVTCAASDPWRLGLSYAYLYETEKALTCLEESVGINVYWYMRTEPLFAKFRDDPRLIALLKRNDVL